MSMCQHINGYDYKEPFSLTSIKDCSKLRLLGLPNQIIDDSDSDDDKFRMAITVRFQFRNQNSE